MGLLKKADYVKILDYYQIETPKNKSLKNIKRIAEDILANKLCKCIKKVQKNNSDKEEAKAIGICNDSIFGRKSLKHYRFTCKKGAKLENKPGKNYALEKRSKRLTRKQKKY